MIKINIEVKNVFNPNRIGIINIRPSTEFLELVRIPKYKTKKINNS